MPKVGSDRLIGMLHAFTLLRPHIQGALRQQELSVLTSQDQLAKLSDSLTKSH